MRWHTFKMVIEKNKTALLLVNLGSPEKPSALSVAKFLHQFLSDKKVIHNNKILWRIILLFIIIPFRSFSVAKKYRQIWGKKSSVLTFFGKSCAKILNQDYNIPSFYSATYGKPSILHSIQDIIKNKNIKKIITLPMFPQYSTTTNEAVFDKIQKAMTKIDQPPTIKKIKDYHDHPLYIAAIREDINEYLKKNKNCQHLLLSYHSVPVSYNEKIYLSQIKTSTKLICQDLKIPYTCVFQSRFGRSQWIGPQINEYIIKLSEQGIKKIAIITPGFATDCLETLEEIKIQAKREFLKNGGIKCDYIAALNDSKNQLKLFKNIYETNS